MRPAVLQPQHHHDGAAHHGQLALVALEVVAEQRRRRAQAHEHGGEPGANTRLMMPMRRIEVRGSLLALELATLTPLMNERYPGAIGSTQGERNKARRAPRRTR